MGAIVP